MLCIRSIRTPLGVSEQGTQNLAGVCVCVTPSHRYRNGFSHSEPQRAAPGVEARGEQPRVWRLQASSPGTGGPGRAWHFCVSILCLQYIGTFQGVYQLRP